MNDLSNYRKNYQKSELFEINLPQSPFQLFEKWFHEAENSQTIDEVNAMTISTIGLDGFPKARVVLLKQFNQNGFVFFTNYNSEKGISIENNPNVCLSFFWPSLERQIIIKGKAQKTSETVSNNYFYSRPKGSQIGAIISNQSQIIDSRELLESKLKQFETDTNSALLRPKHWGGYVVEPIEFEFWQGRPNRLHDRILYKQINSNKWEKTRLQP